MEACAPLPAGAGFIQSILAFIDCRGQLLASTAYGALAAPGSMLSLLLTGFLTLFIALFGYRLLLGHGPDVRTGVLAFVKIGIVLALASSWPAYRALVYDVAISGPGELAAQIGGPSGLPGVTGGLVERLDGADQALVALAILGEGSPPVQVAPDQPVAGAQVAPQPYPGFNTFALGSARMIFLVATIAGLAAVRLIAALLLAVGPFFVAFLLFDNTRALFEGWVRVLAGSALAAAGTAIALAVELALLEPWLSDLLLRRGNREWLPAMPVELLVIASVFALIVLAMLYGSARVAFAFRLAPLGQVAVARLDDRLRRDERRAAAVNAGRDAAAAPEEARSRAAAVVDAVAATQRREAATPAGAGAPRDRIAVVGGSEGARRATPAGTAARTTQMLAPVALGQSFRRTRGRVSASAGRRDHRS
jgi:type IV secretion system protein VirB6